MTPYRVFAAGKRPARRGHGEFLNPIATFCTVDNQAEVVSAMLEERARRALYAGCERAPFDQKDIAA